MRTAGDVLTIDAPAALERLFERDVRYGEIRFVAGSPAAVLTPAINVAYFACGCELGRLSALAGLIAAGAIAWALLPPETLNTVWRWAAILAAGLTGFAIAGLVGERIGLRRARQRLRRLAGEARRRMGSDAAVPIQAVQIL